MLENIENFLKHIFSSFTAMLDEFFLKRKNEKQNLSGCQAKTKYSQQEFQREKISTVSPLSSGSLKKK